MPAPTLADVVRAVAHEARDCIEGTTTSAGGTLQLVDLHREFGKNNQYIGSEAFFPSTLPTGGLNPKRVTGSVVVSGTLTLVEGWDGATAGVPSGVPYYLINIGGRGIPYARIASALTLALDELNHKLAVFDNSLLVTLDSNSLPVFEYTIPSTLDYLHTVRLRSTNDNVPHHLRGGERGLWRVRPGTRTLELSTDLALDTTQTIELIGWSRLTAPTTATGAIPLPLHWLVDATLARLGLRAADPGELNQAMALDAKAGHVTPQYVYPNEVELPIQ